MMPQSGNGRCHPDICVIFNPAAGIGGATEVEKLRHLLGSRVVVQPTEYEGHARALALAAARADFHIVAAAGGDGTVHEVANGVLAAGRPDVAFAIVPVGSANDYYASLEMEPGFSSGRDSTVDVGVVRGPAGRLEYFLGFLGLGLDGAVNTEARKVKGLRGLSRYVVAALRAFWYEYRCPRLSVTIDDGPVLGGPTLMLSVLAGRREGGFVLAPRGSLQDGWLEYIHAGDLSRWEVLKLLPGVALSGLPKNHPKIKIGRCRKVLLTADDPLLVHLDGELFCVPADNVRSLEVAVIPRALTVTRLEVASLCRQ